MWAFVQHVLVALYSTNVYGCSVAASVVRSGSLSLCILHAGQLGILLETADRQHAERTKYYDKSVKHERKEIKDRHLVVRLKITSGKLTEMN